jgi:hypothetical protein
MNVDDVWRTYRQWAGVTSRAAESLERWRKLNLGLILFGAAAGALAAHYDRFDRTVTTTLGAVSAAALALAGVVQARRLSPAHVQHRLVSRAVAEALKGATFRYLADVPPSSGPDRQSELEAARAQVLRLAGNQAGLAVGAPVDEKPLPRVGGIVDYVENRAREQKAWHEERTTQHRERARKWGRAELVATATAAVVAAVGGALHGPDLSAWVAVATTAAAAIGAHHATQQSDRVAESYARTVQSLEHLIGGFDAARATRKEAARFVANVESVLADQNESWVSIFAFQ